jgi:hypothetical protein
VCPDVTDHPQAEHFMQSITRPGPPGENVQTSPKSLLPVTVWAMAIPQRIGEAQRLHLSCAASTNSGRAPAPSSHVAMVLVGAPSTWAYRLQRAWSGQTTPKHAGSVGVIGAMFMRIAP